MVFLVKDEAQLYLQATTCYFWSPAGQTPIVRADPGQAKTNFYGTLKSGLEIAMRSDIMIADTSAQHLEICSEANPDVPIILFWDRASSHCSNPIDKVLEENSCLEINFFPITRLDLNPREHVLKAVRKEVSYNHL